MLERIKALCKKHSVSIADVEDATGIGKNTMYKWDESDPRVKNVKAVADYFGVTVDELLR